MTEPPLMEVAAAESVSYRQVLRELCTSVIAQLSASQSGSFSDVVWPDLSGSILEHVARVFGLSDFETRTLLVAAAVELETTEMLALCAGMLGLENSMSAFLTPFALRRWLPPCPDGTDVYGFSSAGTLRRFGLIQVGPSPLGGGTDALNVVRLSPGTLGFLLGIWQPSAETTQLLHQLRPCDVLGEKQAAITAELQRVLSRLEQQGESVLLNLYGAPLALSQDVASHLEAEVVWVLNLSDVAQQMTQQPTLIEALRRDLALLGGLLIVHEDEIDLPIAEKGDGEHPMSDGLALLGLLLDDMSLPVAILSLEPTRLQSNRVMYSVLVPPMTPDELVDLWQQALGLPHDSHVMARLEEVVAQFSFSSTKITRLTERVHQKAALSGTSSLKPLTSEEVIEVLWEECRDEGRRAFRGIAERITSRATREQLILPASDLSTLDEIVAQVRFRHRVYRVWNYTGARGRGITVLFSGVSGGGKTFAAEVLANELKLDLYRIDLSKVASKWIGETEKNLKKVFDTADEGGAILLFDEADSVFGKRGETQGGNDRYANLTTNYLLQRMEAYSGLAILTTNFEGNIDSAFMRRIRFSINFHKPNAEMRQQLWAKVFPPDIRCERLDLAALAKWDLSGAKIRDVALNASFMAERKQSPVTMEILNEALKRDRQRRGSIQLDTI